MVKRERTNYLIQSVCHSLDVLNELACAKGEMGVTELAKKLDLHKNNIFRILATLSTRGYVEQNPASENYSLGPSCLRMGQSYLLKSDLVTRIRPVMIELSESLEETVSFARLINSKVHYPISIASMRPVGVSQRIAKTLDAKECLSGWLLMAQLPEDQIKEVCSNESTVYKKINDLKSKEKHVDNAKLDKDVVCFSQVVRGLSNSVIGAIEVMVPQYRVNETQVTREMSVAANRISELFAGDSIPLNSKIEKEVSGKKEKSIESAMSTFS